ncbi:histone-lysine N-methyltransferase SETMAR-like [Augochlora pura]
MFGGFLVNFVLNDLLVFRSVTANYAQFWFCRFRLGVFDVKDAPRTGRPVVENIDKITEIIEVDRHVSSRSVAQELKIDHKTVLNHLHKAGFKKLEVWMPHRRTQKTMMLAIDQKRPRENWPRGRGVVFHQDNARPHTSIVSRQKIQELGWDVLMHPPYSPDLAPND